MSATILYLNTAPGDRIQEMTLAGIRRYAEARRWEAESVSWQESRPEDIPRLLAAHRPVAGCVIECADGNSRLPPQLFGKVPTVYLHAAPSFCGGRVARVSADNEAVASAAFRELSAGRPAAYAVVEAAWKLDWSEIRSRTFQMLAARAGMSCSVFAFQEESDAERTARLAGWVAELPRKCAVFVVNDRTAAWVAAAARAMYRSIPHELTLLGVDNDVAICEASDPPISSIQIDHERAGFLAARLLASQMTDCAARRMTGTADAANNDRALHGKTNAADAANDKITSLLPTAARHCGEAVRHCASGAPSLPPSAARHCGEAACHCASGAPSLPPSAARHCASGASSLQRADGSGNASVGPLLAVWRESTRGAGRREPHILAAVELIRRRACEGITAEEVIASAPGSRSLFNLRFREATGHSVLEEIRHVRMEKVETLLSQTDIPLGAIADFCGWGSNVTLQRFFRSRTGMTMREWRRKNRG